MTIEQQLQKFTKNPVAGGVRWEISDDDAFGRVIYLIGEVNDNTNIVISLFNKKIRVWIDCSWTQLKATTIREACEETITLCRERAREIYEALGGFNVHIKHDPHDPMDDLTNLVFVNQNGDTLTTSNVEVIDFLSLKQ